MMFPHARAEALCQEVMLALREWGIGLRAAVQSGGLEQRATSRIEEAIQKWLRTEVDEERRNLVIMREYRNIDFALIDPASVGRARLRVDTVLEIKFNYARQCKATVPTRLPYAMEQALRYKRSVNADSAHLLYFVVAPRCGTAISADSRDTGWAYWESTDGPDTIDAAREAIRAAAGGSLIAECTSPGSELSLYCAAIRC